MTSLMCNLISAAEELFLSVIPISIDKFVASYMKNNPKENRQETVDRLKAAVRAKREGTRCSQCDQVIWAVGTAIEGWNVCFTCLTGEADDSEDYENEPQ